MEEEKIYKDIELRSEEVQEVMNHIIPAKSSIAYKYTVYKTFLNWNSF